MKWFWFPDRDATTREIRWQLLRFGVDDVTADERPIDKDISCGKRCFFETTGTLCSVCDNDSSSASKYSSDLLLHKIFISSWLCASGFSINISLGSRSKISSLAPFVFLFYIWRKQLAVVNIKRRMSRWCVSVLQMLSLRFTVSSVKSDSSHASLQKTKKWRHTY